MLFRSMKLLAWIMSMFVGLMVWVLGQKNDDIKAMQKTLEQHSIQISETLIIMKQLIETDRRQQDLLDRHMERGWTLPSQGVK